MDTGKAYLTRKSNGERIELQRSGMILGKSNSADYVITGNSSVSRAHAKITYRDGSYFVEDLNSLNHTFVDNRTIVGKTELCNGAILSLADEKFIFHMDMIQTGTVELVNNDGMTEVVSDDDDPLGLNVEMEAPTEEEQEVAEEELILEEPEAFEEPVIIEDPVLVEEPVVLEPTIGGDEPTLEEMIQDLDYQEQQVVHELFVRLGIQYYSYKNGMSEDNTQSLIEEIREMITPDPNVCKQCKAKVSPEHNFCPNCGAKLR